MRQAKAGDGVAKRPGENGVGQRGGATITKLESDYGTIDNKVDERGRLRKRPAKIKIRLGAGCQQLPRV